MTRTQLIAIITTELALLDDERVMAVARPREVVLDLTDADRAAIERSKEDTKQGRTYSNDEYHADMAMFMADIKSQHP